MRVRRLFMLPLLALLLTPLFASAAQHALLIGISEYGGSGFSDLDGTINDIDLVRNMLQNKFKFKDTEITILTNDKATHKGIQQAFTDLAKRVEKEDFVYIHFSGHGSYTPDLNGDEKPKHTGGAAYDSTWVPHGVPLTTRNSEKQMIRSAVQNINDFDILDDELAAWLDPVYRKTSHVAFVSDSCHSGTMTRGGNDAPRVRALPVDLRPHPLGTAAVGNWKQAGVQIGAARDDQQASEYISPDGKSYGLFTWHWVQALSKAAPGETWDDLFRRTSALIGSNRESRQQPQLQGEKQRIVFNGNFAPSEQSIAVSNTTTDGKQLTIKAGRFSGITKGSTYKKKMGDDSFVITAVQQFRSDAVVTKGSFSKGDLAVEETHLYPYEPVKVFVRADPELKGKDAGMAEAVRAAVGKLPGYTLVGSQKESDLLLMVLRPKRRNGQLIYAKLDPSRLQATLPQADVTASPEIWVMGPDEQPIHEKMPVMVPASQADASKIITENLKKLSRILELKRLGAADDSGMPVLELLVTRHTPDATCSAEMPVCLEIPDKGRYRRLATIPSLQMQGEEIAQGDILTFSIKNNAGNDLYCYLIDITSNGRISAVFPAPEDSSDAVRVPARTTRDFLSLSGILVEEPGEDTVKLIASQLPLDVTLFEQTAYQTRGEKKGAENPLENFLSRSLGGQTRGPITTSPKRSQWSTVQFSFVGK